VTRPSLNRSVLRALQLKNRDAKDRQPQSHAGLNPRTVALALMLSEPSLRAAPSQRNAQMETVVNAVIQHVRSRQKESQTCEIAALNADPRSMIVIALVTTIPRHAKALIKDHHAATLPRLSMACSSIQPHHIAAQTCDHWGRHHLRPEVIMGLAARKWIMDAGIVLMVSGTLNTASIASSASIAQAISIPCSRTRVVAQRCRAVDLSYRISRIMGIAQNHGTSTIQNRRVTNPTGGLTCQSVDHAHLLRNRIEPHAAKG
jgi:hypothetical protein